MVLLYIYSLFRVILTVFRPLCYVIFDSIGKIAVGKNKTLPPICNKILLMSASELTDHIRQKKLTAEEVMQAYIARVRQVNQIINACVDERFEDAVADAQAVDKMMHAGNMSEEDLANKLPLLGVPFTCKEMIGVKDMAQTNGLLFFKDRKSPSDAEVVAKYKSAGAIPYIVTNVPTLAMMWETTNLVFGRTINPYDNRRTVGGSSGGEAAILTSAGAVIGIGTDSGGSVRVPAAFCGIYGHKPSRDIISNKRPSPDNDDSYDPFTGTGPMCRYVQDLRMLMLTLIKDSDQKLKLDKKVDFAQVKVYYMEEMPGFLLSATSDIKAAVKKAVNHFQDKFGSSPIKLNLKELQYAYDVCESKFIEADGQPIMNLQKQFKINWFWESVKCIFNCSQIDFPFILCAMTEKGDKDKDYYKYLEMHESLRIKLEDILSGEAVLILPTHPEPALHTFLTIPKFKNFGYTSIFNTLGYPATNIPAGMSCGVPIGLQAVATQHKDYLTIATAEELDQVFHGWNSPCEIRH